MFWRKAIKLKGLCCKLYLACFTFLFILAGCGSQPLVSPNKLSAIKSEKVSVNKNWRSYIGFGSRGLYSFMCPVAVSDKLYTISYSGVLYEMEKSTGKVLRTLKLGEDVAAGVSVSDNHAYVVTLSGNLVDIDLGSAGSDDFGSVRRVFLHRNAYSSPLIAKDIIVVQLSDDVVIAVDRESLEVKWSFFGGQGSSSSLSFLGNTSPIDLSHGILTGTSDGRLVLLDRKDGNMIWQISLLVRPDTNSKLKGGKSVLARSNSEINYIHDLDSSISVDGMNIFASASHGGTIALRAQNLEPIWQKSKSSIFSLSVGPVYIYLTDDNGFIYSLDKYSGKLIWTNSDYEQRSINSPILVDGRILVSDYAGYVHVIDSENGKSIGRSRISNVPLFSCVDKGESKQAYFIDRHGFLFSVSAEAN